MKIKIRAFAFVSLLPTTKAIYNIVVMNNENAKLIKSLFDPYFNAPLDIWISFADHMTHSHVKKNEVIKEEYKTENNIHLIIKGSVGVFLWDNNKFKCLDLFVENDFCSDYMSFLTEQATPLSTVALEDVEMISISRNDVHKLYYDSLTGLQIMRSAAESLFVHKQGQQIDLLTKTAEERYDELMKSKPDLINRISGKHIASFLGIAPESMSRIKKKFQEK